jgi:hypothetical protein
MLAFWFSSKSKIRRKLLCLSDLGFIGAAGCARQRFTGKTPSGTSIEKVALPI